MAWGGATNHGVGEVYSLVPPPSLRDLSWLAAFYQLFSMLGVSLLPFSSRIMEKTSYTEGNTGPRVWEERKKKKEGSAKEGRGREGWERGGGRVECEVLIWRDQSLRESSDTAAQSPEDANRLRW